MEYTFVEQSTAFLFSILLGGGFWLVYEPLKILRLSIFRKNYQIIITDIFFMLICTFATFLFAIAFLNGSVRFYMICGEILGFSALYFTLGRVAEKVIIPVLKFIERIISKIMNLFKKILKKLLKILSKVLYNICEKIYKLVVFLKNRFKHKKIKNKKGIAHGRQKKKNRSKGIPGQDKGSQKS